MQAALRMIPAAALAFFSVSSFATTVVYTSSASFLGAVAPGAYTEDFNLFADLDLATTFTGGGFSYALSAPTDVIVVSGVAGTNQEDEALTITFTSGNVFAVGADFFATDINPDFVSTSMTVTLSDGTTQTFTPGSVSDGYRGFTSDVLITSLTISAPGASLYASLDNLTVGTVPEPSSWALAGLGLAGLVASRRRKA